MMGPDEDQSRHRITLDEVNRGFELMEAPDGIRSVIGFG
jgi:Zn-dependent alcohol dehydrogenase